MTLFRLIGELGKPSICAAGGHVLAGALGIALACDLIIAKEGADVRHARDQRRRVPVHDHGADLPQRAAQEDERAAAARRAHRAGEALAAGIVNRVVPAEEFDAAVADWAEKLASKSPLIMRLGKDAMYRQQDMPFLDALDYLRSQLSLALSHRGHQRGRDGVLREARAELEGPVSSRSSPTLPDLRPDERRRARGGGAGCAGGRAAGREPRMVGEPGEPRVGGWAEDLADSRGCLLEAGGQVEDALTGGRPGAPRRPSARSG